MNLSELHLIDESGDFEVEIDFGNRPLSVSGTASVFNEPWDGPEGGYYQDKEVIILSVLWGDTFEELNPLVEEAVINIINEMI